MLQAVGRADIPVKVMVVCAVFKLLFNYITVGIPEINILGAAMGTLLCYVFIMTISMYFLVKITKLKLDYKTVFIKPLISALLCAGVAYGTSLVCGSFVSEKLSTIVGIGCGGIVYVVALFLLRAITEEDIKKLPKGEKLAKLYAKLPGGKK